MSFFDEKKYSSPAFFVLKFEIFSQISTRFPVYVFYLCKQFFDEKRLIYNYVTGFYS